MGKKEEKRKVMEFSEEVLLPEVSLEINSQYFFHPSEFLTFSKVYEFCDVGTFFDASGCEKIVCTVKSKK